MLLQECQHIVPNFKRKSINANKRSFHQRNRTVIYVRGNSLELLMRAN